MARRKNSQKKEAVKKCKVCNEAEAKYKCPVCRIPFKQHKETPCEPFVEKAPNAAAQYATNSHQKKSTHPAAARRFENDVDPRYDLTADQYGLLDANQNLQAQLRDPRLMETLRAIEAARDKRGALDAEMQNPEFLAFCDQVLDCVGYTSD